MSVHGEEFVAVHRHALRGAEAVRDRYQLAFVHGMVEAFGQVPVAGS
ncbi:MULTISPECIES: hypothetical protein [Streptomyces]|uniref:Uncharacterized protein n=1 Tax=Streptomyces chartreusis NRRL 3882 TaxID=1079985 RepID=A0A2N9BAL6_STRCX|nr:hypothetical protein [Streptomyces chartreusis]SOR80399.1 hypothetical protein SCNRRL3882_3854 [Streptomyces chartreusis NRRL 3882]